jgi:hypothetical protein
MRSLRSVGSSIGRYRSSFGRVIGRTRFTGFRVRGAEARARARAGRARRALRALVVRRAFVRAFMARAPARLPFRPLVLVRLVVAMVPLVASAGDIGRLSAAGNLRALPVAGGTL